MVPNNLRDHIVIPVKSHDVNIKWHICFEALSKSTVMNTVPIKNLGSKHKLSGLPVSNKCLFPHLLLVKLLSFFQNLGSISLFYRHENEGKLTTNLKSKGKRNNWRPDSHFVF